MSKFIARVSKLTAAIILLVAQIIIPLNNVVMAAPPTLVEGPIYYPTSTGEPCPNWDSADGLCVFDDETNIQFTKSIAAVTGQPGYVDITLSAKGPVRTIQEDIYVSILFDRSSSMNGTPLTNAAAGVKSFIDGVRASTQIGDANIYLTDFGTSASSWQDITSSDSTAIQTQLAALSTSGQYTNLDRGLIEAYKPLALAPADAIKYLIVMSDGVPTACVGTMSSTSSNRNEDTSSCNHNQTTTNLNTTTTTNAESTNPGGNPPAGADKYRNAALGTATAIKNSPTGVKIVTIAYYTSTTSNLTFLSGSIASTNAGVPLAYDANTGNVVAQMEALAAQMVLDAGNNARAYDTISEHFVFDSIISGNVSNAADSQDVTCTFGTINSTGASCTFRVKRAVTPTCEGTQSFDDWFATNDSTDDQVRLEYEARYYKDTDGTYKKHATDNISRHTSTISTSPEYRYTDSVEEASCLDSGELTVEKQIEVNAGKYGHLYDLDTIKAEIATNTFDFTITLGNIDTYKPYIRVTGCTFENGTACIWTQAADSNVVTLTLTGEQKATLTIYGYEEIEGDITVTENTSIIEDSDYAIYRDVQYTSDDNLYSATNIYDVLCMYDGNLFASDEECYYVPGELSVTKLIRDDTNKNPFKDLFGEQAVTDIFKFSIVGPNGLITPSDFDTCLVNGEVTTPCVFDENGLLELKAGDTAVFSFIDVSNLQYTVTEATFSTSILGRDYKYKMTANEPTPETLVKRDGWDYTFTNPYTYDVCEFYDDLLADDPYCKPTGLLIVRKQVINNSQSSKVAPDPDDTFTFIIQIPKEYELYSIEELITSCTINTLNDCLDQAQSGAIVLLRAGQAATIELLDGTIAGSINIEEHINNTYDNSAYYELTDTEVISGDTNQTITFTNTFNYEVIPGDLVIIKLVRDDTNKNPFARLFGTQSATDEFEFIITINGQLLTSEDFESCYVGDDVCTFTEEGFLVLLAGQIATLHFLDIRDLHPEVTENTFSDSILGRDYRYSMTDGAPDPETEGDEWTRKFINPYTYEVCRYNESLLADDPGCFLPNPCANGGCMPNTGSISREYSGVEATNTLTVYIITAGLLISIFYFTRKKEHSTK